MLRRLFKKYFDYKITGHYYDWEVINGTNRYVKKYNKRYYLKCLHKGKRKC